MVRTFHVWWGSISQCLEEEMDDVGVRDSEGTHEQRNEGSRRRLVQIRLQRLFGDRWWTNTFRYQRVKSFLYRREGAGSAITRVWLCSYWLWWKAGPQRAFGIHFFDLIFIMVLGSEGQNMGICVVNIGLMGLKQQDTENQERVGREEAERGWWIG